MSDQVERDGKLNWDTDCDATKTAMERFLRALVVVGGHFTSSFSLHPVATPQRGVSVFFRVWIPRGREARFVELAKVELKPPPRVSLGWSCDEPDDPPEPDPGSL